MRSSLYCHILNMLGYDHLEKVDRECQLVETLLACNNKADLVEFGIHRGFLNDELRAQAYMSILDLELYEINDGRKHKNCPKLRYYSVIEADVHRSFNSNITVVNASLILKNKFKEQLKTNICKYFQKNKRYQYFQGFNSVTEILLLTFKENYAFCFLEKFSKIFLRDVLDEHSFDPAIQNYFNQVSLQVERALGIKVESMFTN
jgi:hypothetical protein